MNPRIQRFGAILAVCGVLGACGDGRLSSTEVENEVSVLVASSEDTAPLVAARWVLSDSTTTIASGTTDSTGAFATNLQRTEAPYLFLRIETATETLQTIVDLHGASASDTIRTSVNLLTNTIARSWANAPDHRDFESFSDSLIRSVTGIQLDYEALALPFGRRPPEAQVFLNVLNRKVRRSPTPMIAFVDSLAKAPGSTLLHDSLFSRDLADVLREQGLPPETQTTIVQRIDSLGGQDNKLIASFEQQRANADSLLLTSLVPWLSSSSSDRFCHNLVARAWTTANRILAQPRPAFSPDLIAETSRRLALRTYARLLDDIVSPPDSAGAAAFDILLDDADSTLRETFLVLKIEVWFGRDENVDQLLSPIIAASRRQDWKSTALLTAADPASHIAAGWPMPHNPALRTAIEASLLAGKWGNPYDLLIPIDTSKH